MFLPWTPFVLNITLAIFQLLLVGAIDAILAIYSRFGGGYANSVRWTRQGGYPEMLTSLCHSWKNLPKATKVAMIIMIVASLAASLADKGAVYFIIPSVKLDTAEPLVVISPQFAPRGLQRTFSGWISSIRHGADLVDAMTKMINDTTNIPQAVNGRVHTPRTSDYETTCDQFDLHLLNASNLLLSNSGCTMVQYAPYGVFTADYTKASVVHVTKGRWSIRVPATSEASFSTLGTALNILVRGGICALGELSPKIALSLKPGLAALPTTLVTKCVFPTGEISVLSASVVPFFVSPATTFRSVAASVFEEQDDLLQAMEVSINSTTATTNSTLFMELTSQDSSIEVVFCFAYGYPTTSLSCMYSNFNLLIVKQQGMDSPIAKARGGKPLPYPPSTSLAMAMEHVLVLHNGVPQPISMPTMKNATFEAAHYMASLGHNFYADYNEEQLYVLFDTMDPHQGFKVPDWLLISITATMAVCLCLWGAAKFLLDARYTSSLYKVVATQLSPQMGMSAPMLMQSSFEPFEFEHIPVVPVDDVQEADTSKAKRSREHMSC
ncbi:hypothetical protein BGZ75_001012 [Mortierella antarctica]|nr:hypothetical protein BGZ75_001012 [Mortierella antarctica]